jgi:transposase
MDKDKLILEQSKMIAQMQADNGRLMKALAQLQAEYEALKMKFERNQKPPRSSRNSSQPPSRDQKSNAPKDKRKHRHGPPKGHEKHERKLVSQADHVIHLREERCQNCQADLESEAGSLTRINQITELPEGKAQVIEVRQYEITCPCCAQKQIAQAPAGLEMERSFGARLEATVVYYRHEQHMSYERTQKALLNLHGVEISQGGIDGIMQRSGKHAIARLPAIETRVQQSQVIHCDETGSRVDGSNWWEWAFCTVSAVLHVIRFNRSVDVIQEVMGQCQAEVWESDCYGAQLKAPARQRQLCLAHQLRNLQAVVDAHPTLTWPRAMQILFRYAIHLYHQRDLLSADEFAAQVVRVERHLGRLLQRSLSPPDAARLLRRYLKHRQNLLVFLYRRDVEPTNNVAERALRPSVIHRKVTGCFRSDWGAKTYAALASVIDTAELAGTQAFCAIQALFGTPSLPIPTGGE